MNKELINEIYAAALKAEKKDGVPAIFTVAQAILESGWDLKPIKDKAGKNSFNIFGIKYHLANGNFVSVPTEEYVKGSHKLYNLLFQAYDSYQECFEDHNVLLTRYSYAKCLEEYEDLESYVRCVSKDYATDPFYKRKIMNIIGTLREIFPADLSTDVEVSDDDLITESEEAVKWGLDTKLIRPFLPTQVDTALKKLALEQYLDEEMTIERFLIILYRYEKLKETKITTGSSKHLIL